MQTGYAREIGGRAEQQDAVTVLAAPDGRHHLLVVADGMGGHEDGARAARTAIATAERLWMACGGHPGDPPALLDAIFREAHSALLEGARASAGRAGTTLVALYTSPGTAWWAHCGDSRLYHFENDHCVSRTRDHTRVQELFEAGVIREEEMATHPQQNQLLQALGVVNPIRVTHGRAAVTPHTRFLLCSDGFWEHIDRGEMADLLAAPDLLVETATLAAEAARRGGAKGDNVAIATWRRGPPQPPPLHARLGAAIRPALALALLLAVVLAILFWPMDP